MTFKYIRKYTQTIEVIIKWKYKKVLLRWLKKSTFKLNETAFNITYNYYNKIE